MLRFEDFGRDVIEVLSGNYFHKRWLRVNHGACSHRSLKNTWNRLGRKRTRKRRV